MTPVRLFGISCLSETIMSKRKDVTAETDIAQGLHYLDSQTGSVVPPIMPSTTFARDENYELIASGHSYARARSPRQLTVQWMVRMPASTALMALAVASP